MQSSRTRPPDWRLPRGVNQGLWDYIHDPLLAAQYDRSLADSPLGAWDDAFVAEYCSPPGKLIDLGCGTGRTVIASAKRGCWAVGVDLSAEMLRQASRKAIAARVTAQFVQANIVELDAFRAGTFDYATCLFSTLGMVAGRDARLQVLKQAHRLLRPGGRFILHVHNRCFNIWNPAGRRWLLQDLARQLTRRSEAGDRLMPVHQGIAGLSLHLFSRTEVTQLLRQTGFRIVKLQPVGLTKEGGLAWPWFLGWLRAYGYLIACEK